MASFLNAALPSDDEEDEDFAPVLADEGDGEDAEPTDELPDETAHTRAARAARADELWRALARPGVPLPARGCTLERPPPRGDAPRPLEPWEVELGLGQLSRPGQRPSAVLPRDAVTWEEAQRWRARKRRREARARLEVPVFGLLHETKRGRAKARRAGGAKDDAGEGSEAGGGGGPDADARGTAPPSPSDLVSRAKRAMAVARAAAASGGGKRTVTEVRRFAGREVVITRTLAEGEEAAKPVRAAGKARARGRGGGAGAGEDRSGEKTASGGDAGDGSGEVAAPESGRADAAGATGGFGAAEGAALNGAGGAGGTDLNGADGSPGASGAAADVAAPSGAIGSHDAPGAAPPSGAPGAAPPGPAAPLGAPGSAAPSAAPSPSSRAPVGLDAVLDLLSQPKKTSTIEKTRSDWSDLKSKDASLSEELRQHARSGDAYLEQQAFLGRSEYAQYERERDARLGSDVRTRGRV